MVSLFDVNWTLRRVGLGMALSPQYCAQLARALSAYAPGALSGATIETLLNFFTGLVYANVVAAVLVLFRTPPRSVIRLFMSGLVLLAAAGLPAAYFVLISKRDARNMGQLELNESDLVTRAKECKLPKPDVNIPYRFRDSTSYIPFREIGLVISSFFAAIVAICAPCSTTDHFDADHSDTDANANNESTSGSLQKTTANLRLTDADAQHFRTGACSICLENMENGALSMLQCTHVFHETCITKWFEKDSRQLCPVCKTSVRTGITAEEAVSRQENHDPSAEV